MLRVKQTDIRGLLLLLFFCAFFLLSRGIYLDRDEINPDGVNWHYRSEQFIVGLKSGDFAKTYQHYHPGVTLMWIVGPVVELIKQIDPDQRIYDQFNIPMFHFYSKLALISVQLVLTLFAMYLLSKILGKKLAYLSMLLLSVEPFFLGNSRILHMDVLLTLFLIISLLLSYLNLKHFSIGGAILSGLFLALSFLTKSVAIGGVAFVIAMNFLGRSSLKTFVRSSALTLLSFVFFTFLLFPALWVAPISTLTSIFSEAERVGIRKGHDQIVFGEYTSDAGPLFYPLALLMKVSPITLLGALFFVVVRFIKFMKEKACPFRLLKNVSALWYLGIFYMGYFFIMFFPTKKLDRYMLVIYPFVCVLSVLGLSKLLSLIRNKVIRGVSTALLVVGLGYPLVSHFPYYFTYTSPVFGSAENAHKVIAQKPFGMGMFALRDMILENYYYPALCFYDIKPMRAIYPNSRIWDVRVNGLSDCDMFILGPNEEMPVDATTGKYKFEKEHSLYINGLEYWRVYVKKV
ncbi:MAG: glycosyltransferase family 39 protein [Patescibacteria group bacterium]|jgi:hypothetical protein